MQSKRNITTLILILFVGLNSSSFAQSAFFTFFTQEPEIHFLPENATKKIPSFQYVFFDTKTSGDVFPTLPYYFYVYNSYSQSVADSGIVVKIPFNNIDYMQVNKAKIKKTLLPHNTTVYSFSVKANNILGGFLPIKNRFEECTAKFSELYLNNYEAVRTTTEFTFYDSDSVRLAKKQWALATIVLGYQTANSYKHTDTSTQNKLLYILNRTIGTQQNFRDDFVAVSWQSWNIENGVLRCYVVGIENNRTHKCTYRSKVYSFPLNKIDRFEETTDGLVKVVFKENQTGTIELYQAMKAKYLDHSYDDYQETKLLKTAELNALWSIGHTGLTLNEINDWLTTF